MFRKHIRFRAFTLFVVTLLTLSFFQVDSNSAKAARSAPNAPYSWYVKKDDPSGMYNQAYNYGQGILNTNSTQSNLVILDFGAQVKVNNGTTWGASIWASGISNTEINNIVTNFAHGYYAGTGSNTSPLKIVIGTNNSGSYTNSAGGAAWAQLVLDTSSSISSYASQVSVVGGSDMEMQYASAVNTRAWVDGYNGVQGRLSLYDFGNAQCPTSGSYSATTNCSANGNTWNAEDVYYVSWGASPSYPLPEIYSTSGGNAYQWGQLDLYGYNNHSSKMNFIGALTQYGACSQTQNCPGTNNDPFSGWYQLYDAINYTGSPISQDPIVYVTDIRYYSSLYGY